MSWDICAFDPQTDVAEARGQGRNMRSRRRCSMCPAIHITSRSWLRSSSTHEPSDPPLRVVIIGTRTDPRAGVTSSSDGADSEDSVVAVKLLKRPHGKRSLAITYDYGYGGCLRSRLATIVAWTGLGAPLRPDRGTRVGTRQCLVHSRFITYRAARLSRPAGPRAGSHALLLVFFKPVFAHLLRGSFSVRPSRTSSTGSRHIRAGTTTSRQRQRQVAC